MGYSFARLATTRWVNVTLAAAVATLIAVVTPPLWTTHRPRWLPWVPRELHQRRAQPRPTRTAWLFPLCPWAAFAFAGLAAGWLLAGHWSGKHRFWFVGFSAAGVGMYELAMWLDDRPTHIYAVYDFWHSSPISGWPARE